MLDPIALAVEQKMENENIIFYDACKEYMLKNKKELLKSNNKMTTHYINAIRYFSKTLYGISKKHKLFFG